jgi:hypothetical protein
LNQRCLSQIELHEVVGYPHKFNESVHSSTVRPLVQPRHCLNLFAGNSHQLSFVEAVTVAVQSEFKAYTRHGVTEQRRVETPFVKSFDVVGQDRPDVANDDYPCDEAGCSIVSRLVLLSLRPFDEAFNEVADKKVCRRVPLTSFKREVRVCFSVAPFCHLVAEASSDPCICHWRGALRLRERVSAALHYATVDASDALLTSSNGVSM